MSLNAKPVCLAVVILNYNSSDDCKKLVSYLRKQENVDLEIIIVDNNSYDDDRHTIEEFCKNDGCTFIANTENKGYNAGNNVGLRYAAGKGYSYALIANPDMEFPQTDYLQRMTDIMESDENIAVCGSDIITPEGVHQNPMNRDGDWRSSLGWFTGLFKRRPKDTYDFIDQYETSHECSKMSGCCLMVRMSFIKEINYFDEYPFLYCEEAILSRQVEQSRKWKMYYSADMQAIHRHIKNEKGDPIPRFRQWKRSRLYFINRYEGDHWFGKCIAKTALRLYINSMIIAVRIKRIIKHG